APAVAALLLSRPWLRERTDAIDEVIQLTRQRHARGDLGVIRLVHRERPVAAVLPHRMAVDRQLAVPWLHIIEDRHCLRADDGEPAFAIGIKPGCKEVAL